MAIFAIGAYLDEDVSDDFIGGNLVGLGWSKLEAPELHQFIALLKVGDIVYIKSASPANREMTVKAIGVVADDELITDSSIVSVGRNIKWLVTNSFNLVKPKEKNNVRSNTMYEEFHPEVQQSILNRLFSLGRI